MNIQELLVECPVGHKQRSIVDISKQNIMYCLQCRPYYDKLEAIVNAAQEVCDSTSFGMGSEAILTLSTLLIQLEESIHEEYR